MRHLLLLVVSVLALPAASQTPLPNSREYVIEAQRPELEPGRVFVGNDSGVKTQLLQMMARPASETTQVMAELEAFGLDNLAPPMLLEYARRLQMSGKPGWMYYFNLFSVRARVDGNACVDRSAPQFRTVILMEFSNAIPQADSFKQALAAMKEEDTLPNVRRMLDNGEAFSGKASAWWICSHGISTMTAAIAGRAPTLKEWWVGQQAVDAARKQVEDGLRAQLKAKGF